MHDGLNILPAVRREIQIQAVLMIDQSTEIETFYGFLFIVKFVSVLHDLVEATLGLRKLQVTLLSMGPVIEKEAAGN